MQLGFTHVTDEAIEALREIGLPVKRDRPSNHLIIYTHPYDVELEILRDKSFEYGGVDASLPRDHDMALKVQGLKMWKNPDSGNYYYLIEGVVFFKYDKVSTDRSTVPPTRNVISVLDLEEDQDRWIDFFKNIPLAVDSPLI